MTIKKHEYAADCPCQKCRLHRAYSDGWKAHRTHVRKLIGFHAKEAHGVFILPSDTIAALLDGEMPSRDEALEAQP